jgi:hypothetical protein
MCCICGSRPPLFPDGLARQDKQIIDNYYLGIIKLSGETLGFATYDDLSCQLLICR